MYDERILEGFCMNEMRFHTPFEIQHIFTDRVPNWKSVRIDYNCLDVAINVLTEEVMKSFGQTQDELDIQLSSLKQLRETLP